MNYYAWHSNKIEDAFLAHPSLSLLLPDEAENAVICFGATDYKNDDFRETAPPAVNILFIEDDCVHEATHSVDNVSKNQTDLKNDDDTNLFPNTRVFTPLARFRVLSLHCGYDVFGAITSSNKIYAWGKSDKGQCGIIENFVSYPRLISIKTAENLCEHGYKENGREISAASISFGKSLSVAVGVDGSLWSWGTLFANDPPQLEPSRVSTLYGRRVLSIAAGETHFLALVATETGRDSSLGAADRRPSLTSDYCGFVEACAKCRENRDRQNGSKGTKSDKISSGGNYDDALNLDDSTDYCPLGLRLELSGAENSASPTNARRAANLLTDSPSFPVKKRSLFWKKHPSFISASIFYTVGQTRDDMEMSDIRKTKSVGARFSFTSFEYNAAEATSSSESSGGETTRKPSIVNENKPLSDSTRSGRRTKELSLPSTHSVATEVWAWGGNTSGQLGLGDFINRHEPYRIDKLKGAYIIRVDAGDQHSLALSSTGEAWVWGSNTFGQIKQADVDVQPSPVIMKVGSKSSVLSCAAGPDFTLLLVSSIDSRSDIYYCGRNYKGCDEENNIERSKPGVAVRLTSISKTRWPVFVRCSDAFAFSATRDVSRSPSLNKLLELLSSEIKFSYSLKKLHDFVVDLCQQNVFAHADGALLLEAYCIALRKYFCTVCVASSSIKAKLGKLRDPLLLSKFLTIYTTSEYWGPLSHLHSAYCQITASNMFNDFKMSSSMEKIMLELALFNDVESSKPHRLLRKLFHVPFTRLIEYSKLAASYAVEANQPSDDGEKERLLHITKTLNALEKMLAVHFQMAEKTHNFWCKHNGKGVIPTLKRVDRFLLEDFAKGDVSVLHVQENGSSITWQHILVFSDAICFVVKNACKTLEFPLVWIEPVVNENKCLVQLLAPESVYIVELSDGAAKNSFVQCCNQAIFRYQTGPYAEIPPSGTPPVRRHGHHKFSAKHPQYPEAIYEGWWQSGKPHGRGQMLWENLRFFCGKFKNGLMHGLGEMRTVEITGGYTVTKSYWKDGEGGTGLSIVNYANGSRYEGYLLNGQRCGHGVLKQRSSFYVGAWHADSRHGYGVEDRGTEKYLGMWQNNVEFGSGTLITLEGDYYEGIFDRGVFVKGKYIITDGTKYEGDFNGVGILNGKAKIIFLNGDTLEGTLHGSVLDNVKITNGCYKKNPDSVKTPINNSWLDGNKTDDDEPTLPAEQKWSDIFGHLYDSLGIDKHGQPVNCARVWENVVAVLERLKVFFGDSKHSHDPAMERVPNWDQPLDEAYLKMVFEYCSKAFAISYHPFGRLLCGITDVFNACYNGVAAHAKLLPHALAEIFSLVRRVYVVIRYLFPGLPAESEIDDLIAEKSNDSSCKIEHKCLESYGSVFYDAFLQLTYPNLFTLYVLRNDSLDRVYWTTIASLNTKNDVALLDSLGVCKALWPIELKDTDVLDAPLVCATARMQYYADAIDCLQRLSSEFYPSAKLRVIVETFGSISKCVSRLTTDPDSQHTWTADSLVPVTTYVIVRAQIQRLGAEIQLTEDFCPQLRMLGEVQYMFTMLQGCYQHIIQHKTFA